MREMKGGRSASSRKGRGGDGLEKGMGEAKRELFRRLAEALAAGVEELERSAKASHAEATHEQNKSESKYDTRAIEASYLAEGQSRHALELIEAMERLAGFEPRDFGGDEAADLGALVELGSAEGRAFYLIAPSGGGTELEWEKGTVFVLTPSAPLALQMVGRRAGEIFVRKMGREEVRYEVVGVF